MKLNILNDSCMSENFNQSSSLIMLHPYSAMVIVGSVCADFTRFIELMARTGCDATMDYIRSGGKTYFDELLMALYFF